MSANNTTTEKVIKFLILFVTLGKKLFVYNICNIIFLQCLMLIRETEPNKQVNFFPTVFLVCLFVCFLVKSKWQLLLATGITGYNAQYIFGHYC